ncbi:hypothetical protein AVEN_151202-1, partial [Araneus ventricosus]
MTGHSRVRADLETYPMKIDIKEKLKEWGFEELVTGVY